MFLYHGGTFNCGDFIPKNRIDRTNLMFGSFDADYASEYGAVKEIEIDLSNEEMFNPRENADHKKIWDEYVEQYGAVDDGYANDGFAHYENNEALLKIAKSNGFIAIVSSEGNGKIGVGFPPSRLILVK